MLSIETGAVAHSVPIEPQEEDTDDILTFTVGSDSDSLVTAHRSGLLKLWDWRSEFIFYLYLLFPRMYFEMGERRQKTSLGFKKKNINRDFEEKNIRTSNSVMPDPLNYK